VIQVVEPGTAPARKRVGPKTMTRKNHPTRAYTAVEVLVTVAVIMILAIAAMPWYINQRARAQRIRCTSNLKQIGLSYKTWTIDSTDSYPMMVPVASGGAKEAVATGDIARVYLVMSNELSTPLILACPADRERSPVRNFAQLTPRNLSFFVGVDATESNPETLLGGDRNITNATGIKNVFLHATTNEPVAFTHKIHKFNGNILLGDGSVQQVSSQTLRTSLEHAGLATNRLLMP